MEKWKGTQKIYRTNLKNFTIINYSFKGLSKVTNKTNRSSLILVVILDQFPIVLRDKDDFGSLPFYWYSAFFNTAIVALQ